MTLNYDFDIFDLAPKGEPNDPELHDFLSKAGLSKDNDEGAVALFRHQETVDALCRAPESLREYFLQSGFGLNTFDSGAPSGRYPVGDEDTRLAIIERLTENAGRCILPQEPGKNAFRLEDFIAQLAAARPYKEVTVQYPQDAVSPATSKSASQDGDRTRHSIASMTKRVLGGMPLLRQFRRPQSVI
ncbi:hypothetical protein ACSBLW_00855 [Thioclava sp. FR2]|uniref:hypothetical protein n=1 Tax=Thioclava sp. FR2 TaxID=3445780 RepID=UPI003EBCAA15